MSKLRRMLFTEPSERLGSSDAPGVAEEKSGTASLSSASEVKASKEEQRTNGKIEDGVISVESAVGAGVSSFQRTRKGSRQASTQASSYQALKTKIHNRLIDNLDVRALMQLDGTTALESAVERAVHVLLDEDRLPISAAEREKLARDV